MALNTVTNGQLGSGARAAINAAIAHLNALGLGIQFSADNTNWHYPYQTGDGWIRYSGDFGGTWSSGFFAGQSIEDLDIYVEKVAGSRLITEAEAALLVPVVYTINLPSAPTVAQRCSLAVEGVDYPDGWVLEADTAPADLKITHGLARAVANVTVWSLNSGNQRQLYGNAAFSGVVAPTNNVLTIEALATIETALTIQIIFGTT